MTQIELDEWKKEIDKLPMGTTKTMSTENWMMAHLLLEKNGLSDFVAEKEKVNVKIK